MEKNSVGEGLAEVREDLHQEWADLQILGRALTEQEKQRSEVLQQALKLIDEALVVLDVDD